MDSPRITILQAAVLGVIEGLTEYLPVSSTGHLILASHGMGLDLESDGVRAFLIVIQGGAIAAVLGVYRRSVASMLRGLAGRDPEGLRMFMMLMIAFVPAAAAGLTLGPVIKQHLFGAAPVAAALAIGGAAMIAADRMRRDGGADARDGGGAESESLKISDLTPGRALAIGLAQSLALIPGTSRSMVTILGGMMAGLPRRAAAEFSFLLALPTLGGATAHDLLRDGGHILEAAGIGGLVTGAAVSWVVAALAIRWFLRFLVRHGMTPFGVYRIALGALVFVILV